MQSRDSSTESSPRKTKRGRFLDVAQRRTRRVLRELRLLGNCGNTAAYEYADRDVEKIFSAVTRELELARSRFKTGDKKKEDAFSLD